MNILNQKINRYIISIIILFIITIIPNIRMVPFVFLIGAFEAFVYFLLILTIGRLIKNDLIAISFNLGLITLNLGVLFKITHWINADLHLIIGKVSLAICLITGLIVVFFDKK